VRIPISSCYIIIVSRRISSISDDKDLRSSLFWLWGTRIVHTTIFLYRSRMRISRTGWCDGLYSVTSIMRLSYCLYSEKPYR